MDLSIIIVNWNSLAYLRECLSSVYEHTRTIRFEVIVVDNASPEGGVQSILKEFPDIHIVESAENIGFARANNLGFQSARGEYVLLLNPDTKLLDSAIELLVTEAKRLPDAGIVGGKLLNGDLSVQTQAIQTFPTVLNQLLNIESLRLRRPDCSLWKIGALFRDCPEPIKVDVIPGACMLLKSETFRRLGGFDGTFFMYGEDVDLNYRVRELGLTNYYIGRASIIHYGGKSSSRQRVSNWSTVMKYTAMSQLYRTHRGLFYSVLYRSAMGLSAGIRVVLLTLATPFVDRETASAASSKWATVLKWSLGITKPSH